VAFSPDGAYLTAGQGSIGTGYTPVRQFVLYDLSRQTYQKFPAHGVPLKLVFSPDGSHLAAILDDGTVDVLDIAGKSVVNFHEKDEKADALRWMENGRQLLVLDKAGTLRWWSMETKHLLRSRTPAGSGAYQTSFSLDATGNRLLQVDDVLDGTGNGMGYHCKLTVWDLITGKPTCQNLDTNMRGAIFSPDGTHVAGSDRPDDIEIWDLDARRVVGEPIHFDSQLQDFVFSHDGRAVISVAGDAVRTWETATGMPLIEPLQVDYYGGFACSDDGGMIVCGNNAYQKPARLWTLPKLAGGEPWVNDMALAASGMEVMDDGQLRQLTWKERLERRDKLRTVHPSQASWASLLAWWLSPGQSRPASP